MRRGILIAAGFAAVFGGIFLLMQLLFQAAFYSLMLPLVMMGC